MRPVSSDFLNAIRGSHRLTVRARVVEIFQSGTDPDGTEIDISGGDVLSEAKVYGGSEVYGSLVTSTGDVVASGAGMWPSASDDLFAPYGNELYLERGIAYGNGVTEWVSLGFFRIDTVNQKNAPDGEIRLSASDRWSGIEDARFTEPVQYTKGTWLGAIIDQLVGEVYPNAIIEWDDNTNEAVLGRNLIFEKDRIGAISDLVTSVGKMAFWDYRGVLVIRDIPDPSSPVFDVNAGPNGVLVEMGRDLSREGVYNAVVATGEAADDVNPPVTAIAVDGGPDSPTRWNGPFGRVPRFYSSPFVTTTEQAESAARSILGQSLGLPYNVDFTSVPNVALEPLDPVSVTYPKTLRSDTMRQETHILKQIRYPLGASQAMSAQTREQKLVTVDFLRL